MGDIKFIEKMDNITGEKELVIDKRTLPHKKPTNYKGLKYARNLPPECNGCPFRPQEEGGNGICTKYEKDALCVIRSDISKLVDSHGGRTLDLMEGEFNDNYEKLKFFEQIEDMTGALDPEVTKRINSVTNLGKVIEEVKSKRNTVEITEKKSLTDDQIHEIARTIKLTRDDVDES
tara:strand:+ start:361 stop:888 length:528 start_codon:yes stop_codon:yes gene_type:complete